MKQHLWPLCDADARAPSPSLPSILAPQGSLLPPTLNPRPTPPVVRLDLLLEGLTTGAALLPSLRAHYHMGPLTGTGCTGAQARFTVHLPHHSLSFNTKVGSDWIAGWLTSCGIQDEMKSTMKL